MRLHYTTPVTIPTNSRTSSFFDNLAGTPLLRAVTTAVVAVAAADVDDSGSGGTDLAAIARCISTTKCTNNKHPADNVIATGRLYPNRCLVSLVKARAMARPWDCSLEMGVVSFVAVEEDEEDEAVDEDVVLPSFFFFFVCLEEAGRGFPP